MMWDEPSIQLYYWHEADNFLLYYPGDFFNAKWIGTPNKRMILQDPKYFKLQTKLWKSEQGRKCHLRLIDKNFCKLGELK